MDAFIDYIHLADNVDLSKELKSICEEYLSKCHTTKKYRGERTTFFDNQFINDTRLIKLYDFVVEESLVYLDVIGVDRLSVSPSITALWFSNIGSNGNHQYHSHSPGSHLSGTFYIDIEPDSSPIIFLSRFFYNDIWIDLPYKEKNMYSASTIQIPSKNGRLLLWKSDMIHGVVNNQTDVRNTCSFNITFFRK